MTLMLEVERLCAHHGRAQLLFDVGFSARPGEVLLLVGRNGAGKSTTLKAIMGLLREASGSVRFSTRQLMGLAPHAIARLGLGYVPEDRRIFTGLSVAENLEVGRIATRANVSDAPHWNLARIRTLFPRLGEMLDRPGAQMSGGEQQMLAIARTLMGNPRAILLDEPSEGLAPIVVDHLIDVLLALKREGLCIVLSEQNLTLASAIADRAVIIERGVVRYEGDFQALSGDTTLAVRYLAA
ncbi:MAG: ABC transporter ATP-binding protein [Burkholderiales bacterium]|nr:ABC transporter ATP-binding protein [Burkholderiales bacterium]